MASKAKVKRPTQAKRSPDYLDGVFAALDAAAHLGALRIESSETFHAIAERLGVPVLLIEAAQSYERADVDALVGWWATREGAG